MIRLNKSFVSVALKGVGVFCVCGFPPLCLMHLSNNVVAMVFVGLAQEGGATEVQKALEIMEKCSVEST